MHKPIIFILLMILCSSLVTAAGWDLVSRYKFDGDLLDEISTNNLKDSGSGSYSTNRVEGTHSYDTNGVDGTENVTFSGMGAVQTVSFWFNVTGWTGDKGIAVFGETFPTGLQPYADGSANLDVLFYSGTTYCEKDLAGINSNQWYNLVFQSNATVCRIWLDGGMIHNDTSTIDFPAWTEVVLGANGGGLTAFDERIDNIVMSNRMWTSVEIDQQYADPSVFDPVVTTGIMNITLDYPFNATTNTSLNQNFTYQIIDEAADINNCSLMTNSTSAGWVYNTTDSNPTNNTNNTFFNIEFEDVMQDGTDILWNVECEDAGGDINSSSENRTLTLEKLPVINLTYLTSPTPDQLIGIDDIGNTTDVTPTWNVTVSKQTTCFISPDNNSWEICGTTDAIGSICTDTFNMSYDLDTQYFKCNSSLTDIAYSAALIRVFSFPNVTSAKPANNSYEIEGVIEFNATITDFTNLTMSCNLTNATSVVQTNTSVNNNSVVRFYQTLGPTGSWNWSISCSNGWFEGIGGEMNLSVSINYGTEIDIYLDGSSSNRKYEFGTTANITTVSNFTGAICIDIYDNTSRHLNVSCSDNASFQYKINKTVSVLFSDATTVTNITNSTNTTHVMTDNRTDLVQLDINITGIENGTGVYPEDIVIDIGNDSSIDAVIPGRIINNNYEIYKWISNNVIYVAHNLTYERSGEKIIYINKTNAGNNRSGILNFTLTAYDIDSGNAFSRDENFSTDEHYNTTAQFDNYTMNTGPYDMFVDNITKAKWNRTDYFDESEGESLAFDVYDINDSVGAGVCAACVNMGVPSTRECLYSSVIHKSAVSNSKNTKDVFPDLDFRYIDSFTSTFFISHSGNGGKEWRYGFAGEDGGAVWLIDVDVPGASEENRFYNVSGYKSSENIWTVEGGSMDISVCGSGSPTPLSWSADVSTLNGTIKLVHHQTAHEVSAVSTGVIVEIYKDFNISGLWLNMSSNGTYHNKSINWSHSPQTSLFTAPNNIVRVKITSYHQEPVTSLGRTNVSIYVSNDNGTTWETAVNDTFHVFESTGSNFSIRYQLQSDSEWLSPTVSRYVAEIIPASGASVIIDVGNDGTLDWNISQGLTSANTPIQYNGSDDSIVAHDCLVNQTCLIPIKITVNQSQMLEISGMNYTKNPNPLNFTNISFVERENNISVTILLTKGLLAIQNMLEFYGSKNITIFAYKQDKPTVNDSQVIQVRYSHFNMSLPSLQAFWQIFPKSADEANIEPYGQNTTDGIFRTTTRAYDDPFYIYVKYNESIDSCVQNMTFAGVNITKPYHNNQTLNVTNMTTTFQQLMYLNSTNSTGDIWTYTDIACEYSTAPFYIPYFCFKAICEDCVKTNDWNASCDWIE